MQGNKKLINLFENLHKITKARISLYDTDYNEIYAYPKNNLPFCREIGKHRSAKKQCSDCDKSAFEKVNETGRSYTYECHCGIVETVAPIYSYGELSGYIMMGQIAYKDYRTKQNIRDLSEKYFESGEMLTASVLRIPEVPRETMAAYINLLNVMGEYITNANLIPQRPRDMADRIRGYIDRNLTEDIKINKLAEEMNCSRATVMNSFKKKFNVTVNSYITDKRLKLASEMLIIDKNDTIKKIAEKCGYPDQNYFSRIFCEKFGKSPSEYRSK